MHRLPGLASGLALLFLPAAFAGGPGHEALQAANRKVDAGYETLLRKLQEQSRAEKNTRKTLDVRKEALRFAK